MRSKSGIVVLSAGLILVFLWFGVVKFTNPSLWIQFLPDWLDGFLGLPNSVWLNIMGVAEIVMAVMLIVPVRRTRQLGALLMALHLVGVISQTGFGDVGIRDLGLLFSSVALLLLL